MINNSPTNRVSLVLCIVIAVLMIIFIPFNNNGKNQDNIVVEATNITEETVPTVLETTEPETEPVTEPTETEPVETEPEEWEYDDSLSAEKNIFIYLTEYLGYPNAAACGIVSNIAHETGWTFNPNIGSQYCYGLIQWTSGRLSNLKNWCYENGKDYTTIQGQLDFMHWELVYDDTYGTYDYIMQCEDSTDGAYNAGWYFCYWFERPANASARANLRGSDAIGYYNSLVVNREAE